MILYFYQLIIIHSIISVLSFPSSSQSTTCNQTCGQNPPVQYPFGFSGDCGIKLNCSSGGEMRIGDFLVRNVTSDQILINLPANCSRPIGDLNQLRGANFAPTWRNGLLLENCSRVPSNDCVVPTRLLSNTGFKNCNSDENKHNFSCYSGGLNDNSTEFLDYEIIRGNGSCFLFSSIMVGLNRSVSLVNQKSSIPLDFQIMELGWWVSGSCGGCDPNATCARVANGTLRLGFRCKCNQGFTGDGFADGRGCHIDGSKGWGFEIYQ